MVPEFGSVPRAKFAAGVTYLDLLPTVAGDYKLCLGETQVAALSVLPAQCVFNHQDMSPCSEEVCTMYGFEDERCQKYVTEYCAEHAEDSGCSFIAPRFQRPVGMHSQLSLHVGGVGLDLSSAEFVSQNSCNPLPTGEMERNAHTRRRHDTGFMVLHRLYRHSTDFWVGE